VTVKTFDLADNTPKGKIGFLLSTLHSGAAVSMWRSVVSEIVKHSYDAWCFPGGRLCTGTDPEHPRNAVYSLARSAGLQGLVSWTSSLGGKRPLEDIYALTESYAGLPLVTMGLKVPGFPAVLIDSDKGMQQIVEHLVTVHQVRRIAFLGGPETHQSARERIEGFRKSLAAQQLPVLENLIVPGLDWDGGDQGIATLIDERKLLPGRDFDALVAPSDLLAFTAYQALKKRGYLVPADVLLVGFNDTTEARLTDPPLTTARIPFEEQGKQAVQMLMGLLSGAAESDQILEARLCVRTSCSCSTGLVPHIVPGDSAFLDSCVRAIEHSQVMSGEEVNAWVLPFVDTCTRIVQILQPGEQRSELESRALRYLSEGVKRSVDRVTISAWYQILAIVRSTAYRLVPGTNESILAPLFERSAIQIGESAYQSESLLHWQNMQLAEKLRLAGRDLQSVWTLPDFGDTLQQVAQSLEIEGLWVVLERLPHDTAAATDPSLLNLVYAQEEGRRYALSKSGYQFSREFLLPALGSAGTVPRINVVHPLFFGQETMGYMVFQTTSFRGIVFEELRGYITGAIKGIFLFSESLLAKRQAEKADAIKSRLLANVSHEMRTPLNHIMNLSKRLKQDCTIPDDMAVLDHIHDQAEHQYRMINDLLDLSRAEIDELELTLEISNPRLLLQDIFNLFVSSHPVCPESQPVDDHGSPLLQTAPENAAVQWVFNVPEQLPFIRVDVLRFRQVFFNLLANAAKFTQEGSIELGARLEPPYLHIWVSDTGPGMDDAAKAAVFEPFVTGDSRNQGIGLGLSISRHMVALHRGSINLESVPGQGSVFHVFFPLPNLANSQQLSLEGVQPVLLRISHSAEAPAEILEFAQRLNYEMVTIDPEVENWQLSEDLLPSCILFDLQGNVSTHWPIIRRLRQHPRLMFAPFITYAQSDSDQELSVGLTGIIDKSAPIETMMDLVKAHVRPWNGVSIFIVDDEADSRQVVVRALQSSMGDVQIREFADAESALAAMLQEAPGLVIADLMMPEKDGFYLIEVMRSREALRVIPVIVLSSKVFSQEDVQRLEQYSRVVLQSKGIWRDSEIPGIVSKLIDGKEFIPQHTSAVVKRALAFLTRKATKSISRWQIAEAVFVSEDYLTRLFSKELGISPWEFLNRYRIYLACEHLKTNQESIRAISSIVGFNDQAYFSRVFKKLMQCTPQEYRNRFV